MKVRKFHPILFLFSLFTILIVSGCGGSSESSGFSPESGIQGVTSDNGCVWDRSDWDECNWN